MRIALTYDLRSEYLARGYSEDAVAEFDSIETIQGIETALVDLGATTTRVGGITELVPRLARGEH